MSSRGLLITDFPDIFSEMVVLDKDIASSSGKSVEWRCKEGHLWYATPASRIRGSGCPYCSGRRRIVGVNDLATTHPDLAVQLVDRSLGTMLSPGSSKVVEWRCENGHVWSASVRSRTGGNGCPVCSNHKVVPGINDLATTHPEIAAELVDSADGTQVSYGSGVKLRWRCKNGHVWSASVVSRTVQGHGCPVCAGIVGIGSKPLLRVGRPDLACELVDTSLRDTLTMGSNRYVDWRCAKGHVWRGTVANRVRNGQKCPYCSGKLAVVGETDLATVRPELAAQLVDRSLATVLTVRSSKQVMWKCDLGHTWSAGVSMRADKGTGCPYCSNQKVLVGFNDLATTHPEIAAELVCPEDGLRYVAGSSARLRWRCGLGHEWEATVVSRTRSGSGCPVCANKRIEKNNSLRSLRPDIADQLVDQSLGNVLSVGSRRIVSWQCENGHVWQARVCDRCGSHASGCPVCGLRVSAGEHEVAESVRILLGSDVEVLFHDRIIIAPQELDVVVPSKHIAIEFNGVWWHSEEAGKGKRYHLEKRLACEAAGYQLIQVWEDVWRDRRDVVLRMLAAKLGCSSRLGELGLDARYSHRLFARKLDVRRVDGHAAREFLEKNHVQGAVSATRHLGLFSSDELVALLSIRSPNNNARMRRKAGEWEIQRYATACSVVGGFTRLLAHAERELRDEGVELSRWVSFSSCDVSDGHMYEACGFSRDVEIRPEYMYVGSVTNWIRAPKESFQKRRFRERDDLVFKEGLTERELARMNGLLRCFDSGKIRWVRDVL